MERELSEFLEERMRLPEGSGKTKVMFLPEAVRRFIKPGMSIQTGNGTAFPTAAYSEIARQFWGKKAGFTLIGNVGGAYNFSIFAHGKGSLRTK